MAIIHYFIICLFPTWWQLALDSPPVHLVGFYSKEYEQYLLDLIRSMMQDEHHVPRGVLYSQLRTAVQRDLSENLNHLLEKNRIVISKTVNDILITLQE